MNDITFQSLNDLPIPIHLSRNLMSLLTIARLDGVLYSGDDDKRLKAFTLTLKGSGIGLDSLTYGIRRIFPKNAVTQDRVEDGDDEEAGILKIIINYGMTD